MRLDACEGIVEAIFLTETPTEFRMKNKIDEIALSGMWSQYVFKGNFLMS